MPRLVELETASFEVERISRAQFRRLLAARSAAIVVAEQGGTVLGHVVVLFRGETATARLYSIAVAPAARGQGVGRALAEAAEMEAWRREIGWMRLEVRKDHPTAITLYESLGYRRFGEYLDYYDDHRDAWRYEKQLDARFKPPLGRVPYYRQTFEFTGGPACLLMAMAAHEPTLEPDATLELRLWREATTTFQTARHGGCGPLGLALAAARRGFAVEVATSRPGGAAVAPVDDGATARAIAATAQADLEGEAAARRLAVRRRLPPLPAVLRNIDAGAVPVILVRSWQIYEQTTPRWIVLTGYDERFLYAHDPRVDGSLPGRAADAIDMPIGRRLYRRMSAAERGDLQAMVLVSAGGRKRPER